MIKNPVARRLLPLYVSIFFQGLIFWYAIEKVFMVHIGFTATTIATATIVMTITGLLLEVPSGILADRWSRKGVLILACVALTLASVLMGLSRTVPEYILAGCLFGIYFSLHSGTYDAMVYDTLIEERNSRDGYEMYLGRTTLVQSIGLVIGSLLGGVVGTKFGLSASYFWSVPSGLLAVAAAMVFKEPKLHKAQPSEHIWKHTKETMQVVLQKGHITLLVVTLLVTTVVYDFLLEVDQLWPLALNLHTLWYGPLNALLLLGYGLGGTLAGVLARKRSVLLPAYGVGVVAVYLLTVKAMPVVAVAQFAVIVLFMAFYTLALGKLHDALPSKLRSSSSSAIGTLTSLVFVPLVFLFGWLVQRYTVFHAAYMLLPLAIISVVGMFIIARRTSFGVGQSVTEQHQAMPTTSIGQ